MVYVISDGTFLKIGCTRDIETRIQTLQTANPRKLKIIKAYETTCFKEDLRLESYLHRKFQDYRVKVNGRTTEWFLKKISDDIDQAVYEGNKKDNRYFLDSYMSGMNSTHLAGDSLIKQRDLSKKYKKLKCENQKLLNEIQKYHDDISTQNPFSYNWLLREKNELSKKNKQLAAERDAALRRNRSLIGENNNTPKTETVSKTQMIIDEFPELLTKHDLEELFEKPFYELIDKAADIGAEVVVGKKFLYKRDVLKEAIERGGVF